MDMSAMLALIQENHRGALEALANQVHALRETCALQQKEMQLMAKAHEKASTKALLDQMLLRRLLDESHATTETLGETVRLLNKELEMKKSEAAEAEDAPQLEQSPSFVADAPRLLTHSYSEAQLRDTVETMFAQSHDSSNALSSHSMDSFPQARPLVAQSNLGDTLLRISDHSSHPCDQSQRRRRRPRYDSLDNPMSQTTTINTSMDLSYPSTLWPSAAPQVPDIQVFNVAAPNSSRRRQSEPESKPPPREPLSHSSRLERELQSLRAKLQACSSRP
ncbi:hypothetical protein LEN26_006106 [Aphanomyces euteiches]|nr:hypothetical protein LEN26_006106 [Aphanomyces euteiches]